MGNSNSEQHEAKIDLKINESLNTLLKNIFGKKLDKFISSCKELNSKYIRFNLNRLRNNFPQYKNLPSDELSSLYKKYLSEEQIFLSPTDLTPFSSVYKVTTSHHPIGATPDFLKGFYYISDLASNVPIISLSPKPSDFVLDMCAAPGGKTCHIADLLNNSGYLIANDFINPKNKSSKRFNGLLSNINRCGFTNVAVTNLNGNEIIKYIKNFDKVLLDAPCSGTGLLGRDSKIGIKRDIEQIRDRAYKQKELILSAIDLVKKGGVVVYSTCSITIEENEEVVDYALRKRKVKLRKVFEEGFDMGVKGFRKNKGKVLDDTLEKSRRFYPHLNDCIGFYVAKLEKIDN